MKRRNVGLIAALLAVTVVVGGDGAGAGEIISGSVKAFAPVGVSYTYSCAVSECGLFTATGCTDQTWVQSSSDDPKPTAGNLVSIVAVPPAARGKNGLMEWKLTGSAAADASIWFPIKTDCDLGNRTFELAPAFYQIPADTGWLAFYKGSAQAGSTGQGIWWRWRQV